MLIKTLGLYSTFLICFSESTLRLRVSESVLRKLLGIIQSSANNKKRGHDRGVTNKIVSKMVTCSDVIHRQDVWRGSCGSSKSVNYNRTAKEKPWKEESGCNHRSSCCFFLHSFSSYKEFGWYQEIIWLICGI